MVTKWSYSKTSHGWTTFVHEINFAIRDKERVDKEKCPIIIETNWSDTLHTTNIMPAKILTTSKWQVKSDSLSSVSISHHSSCHILADACMALVAYHSVRSFSKTSVNSPSNVRGDDKSFLGFANELNASNHTSSCINSDIIDPMS